MPIILAELPLLMQIEDKALQRWMFCHGHRWVTTGPKIRPVAL